MAQALTGWGAVRRGLPPEIATDIDAGPGVGAALCGIAQGTQVLTLEGALPVEFLHPGDRVITRNGARRLAALEAAPAAGGLIRVAPGALGHDRPERALILGAEARVLLRDWRAQALFGTAQALVPVARLVDGQFVVPAAAARGTRLFALRFAGPEVIYADGVEIAAEPVTAPA